MKLEFDNIHFDGKPSSKWDVLLRIVGDFALSVGGRVIYREVEFCLVEFGCALAEWLVIVSDLGPDFTYTSLESETPGLVVFTRADPGEWRVSSAYQERKAEDLLTTSQMKDAATTYLRCLRAQLLPKIDLVNCIEDRRVRLRVSSLLM